MNRGGRKYKTRDPQPSNRDPQPEREQRKPRLCVPAGMPVVCPKCGGPTRMSDGRHVDTANGRIVEGRTCARGCADNDGRLLRLGAVRDMTNWERRRYRVDEMQAVAREYQDSIVGT